MQLTKNFTLAEFACKDGTAVPPQFYSNVTRLAQNLQILRDHIGLPVVITGSGYRTAIHNKKVKGAVHSQHLTASAADINVKGYTPHQLAVIMEKLISKGEMLEGGIGIYKSFVHYDIRGVKVRW